MSLPNSNDSIEQQPLPEPSDPENVSSPSHNEKENSSPSSDEKLTNLRQSLALLNRMLMPPPNFIPSYRRKRVDDKQQQRERLFLLQGDRSVKSGQSAQKVVGRGVIQCPYNKHTKKTDTANCTNCRQLNEEKDSGVSPEKKLKYDSCDDGHVKDVEMDSKDKLENEKQKCHCEDKHVKNIAGNQEQQQETTFPVKIKLERLSTGEYSICKNAPSVHVTGNDDQSVTNG